MSGEILGRRKQTVATRPLSEKPVSTAPSNYGFGTEPNGAIYAELIAFCCSWATEALLVERRHKGKPTQSCVDLLARLQPFELRSEQAHEWPGTRAGGKGGNLHYFRVCRDLQLMLTEARPRLFDWEGLDDLEDLCFRMSDGRWLLTTIAHEDMAWLELTPQQVAFAGKHYPQLAGSIRPERK